jgi:Uma2 family endonuclease
MAQAGILTEDDRVELIEGEIIKMTPVGSRHAACVDRLTHRFSASVRGQAIVRVQNPIRLSERSESQPDLALLRFRPDFYASFHPGRQDVLLVVEVAETSVDLDREIKLPLYARSGIAEAWLVDLAGEQVEVYRRPTRQGYEEVQRVRRGARVRSQALPDLDLGVDEILG